MTNQQLFTLAFLTWIASLVMLLIFAPAALVMWFASLYMAGVSFVRSKEQKGKS